jgi:hypothetical protein
VENGAQLALHEILQAGGAALKRANLGLEAAHPRAGAQQLREQPGEVSSVPEPPQPLSPLHLDNVPCGV